MSKTSSGIGKKVSHGSCRTKRKPNSPKVKKTQKS